MRSYAAAVTAATPAAAVLQRACDCASHEPGDEMCPACAAKAAGVQPSMTVGPVDDAYEREADATAERVMQPAPEAIQRELQTDEDEEKIQPKTAAGPRPAQRLGAGAGAAAQAVAGGGAPLPRAERAFFEPRFGRDLGHVRLHTDAAAGLAARGIGARAYTLRNHIAFAPGQFAPGTTDGRRLIAHELTHTLQQSAPALRRLPLDLVRQEQDLAQAGGAVPIPGVGVDRDVPRETIMSQAEARAMMDCQSKKGQDEISRAECLEDVLGVPVPIWKSVPGISSPVPFRAAVAATGEATTKIGPVNLTILPDATTTDTAKANGAETAINFAPLPAGQTNGISWVSQGGKVTSFVFNQDYFSLSIQTTYGPGASAGGSSGYGRGTTTDDKNANQTSLGFHEGEHGRDFITYLERNPYPVFAGKTGQASAVFAGHAQNFSAAVSAYIKNMSRLSELRTDCAGKSIDTFKAEKGTATTMCVRKTGDPTP